MEIKLEEINRLLKDTQTLQFYEKQLTQATGEHFNVFEILRIGSREVTTHSPMLAELLNPNGGHGMGSRFLEIFTKQPFAKGLPLELEADSAARVEQEHCASLKGEDGGGRIDIFIKDKNDNEVVIENKIYATDQEKQITRYLNERPRAQVLYLTLDGHEPTEDVSEKDTPRFACISYKSDIIQWLDACRKEAAHSPLVRETIAQYINLIKVLTGQNTNSRMNDQITKAILRDKDSLEAYFTLVRSREDVINELLKKLEVQCKEIGAVCGLEVAFGRSEYHDHEIKAKYGGFFFFDEVMKKQNLCIGFQFDRKDLQSLEFGIAHLLKEENATRSAISNRFESAFGERKFNSWWPAYISWPERQDWWDGTFRDIYSGDFKKELQAKVEKLAEILRQPNV